MVRKATRRTSEFKTELKVQKKILKEVLKMAQSLQELQAAIEAVGVAVKADVEQDKEVVRLTKVLIEKIKTLPNAADFTNEITALSAATAELTGDNEAVQAALDEAGAA